MSVTHTFVSAIPDSGDATLVQPSDWNAAHTVSIADADVAAGAAIAESKLALNFATHAAVTIGTANGLSLATQALSLGLASAGVTGALSGTDWSTFNAKQAALTLPLAASQGGTGIANGASATLTLPNAATTITTGGTLALGGFTLTVPATGTAALLATANVFTAAQTATLGSSLSNTFFGDFAGRYDVGAFYNVGIGQYALASLAAGLGNFGLGYSSLRDLTTGDSNTAVGANSLRRNGIGDFNVAIGNDSGFGVTGNSFSYNTLVGGRTGYSLTTGSSNIMIGYHAGYRQTTLSSLLIIDNQLRASAAVELTNSIFYGVMGATPGVQTLRINAVTSIILDSATTATAIDVLTLQANSTGTVAAGFGVNQYFKAETATADTAQIQALISTSWIDATNVSRKAKMSLSAYDTAARLGIEIEASGTAAKLGFFGVATVVRPTALTTQLTAITHTAPGTPDYALQDLIDSSAGAAFGFATKDEGNTLLSVVKNLQTRVGELETKLQALGLLT